MGEHNLYPNSQITDLQQLVPNLKIQGEGDQKSFMRLKKGQNIYIPGQAANYLYVVIKGSVKTCSYLENGQELVGSILSEGDLFGEECFQPNHVRLSYAQCREKSTIVYRLHTVNFWNAIKTDHKLCVEVIELLSKRITTSEDEKRRLKYISASQKMTAYLKHMAGKYGVKVGFETVFENNLTHKELGSILGVSRQTVTSLLNDFKRANLINFDKKRILIRDVDALQV